MVTQLSALPDEASPLPDTPPRSHPARQNQTPRQIPWGYGRDRVTALVVDPVRLFIYWEVSDGAIEAARTSLGPAGARATVTLRIYDTTGRIFDGANAHSHFDQDIDRNDRQWFCHVGKPASTAHVELGLRGDGGQFVRIMRSGRVDFPRAEPAPYRPSEWMRVVAATGDVASRELSASAPGRSHSGGGAGGGAPGEGFAEGHGSHVSGAGSELTSAFEKYEIEGYELKELEFERYEYDSGWQIDSTDPSATYRYITSSWEEMGFGTWTWETGPMESSWEAGPFQYPTEVVVPTAERFEGPTQVYRVGEQVRMLHGPWQVVIRGIQPRASHRVLARWEVHRSWISVAGRPTDGTSVSAGQNLVKIGSSDRFALSASELRLRGASEVFFLGASERRLMGASETRFVAASHWLARGASERRLTGASEWRLMGASERRLMGASERRLMGASERRLGGASERRLGGASERQLGGASERRPGGSEPRFEGEDRRILRAKG